jgi:lysophospholipid acyltransferase 5
VTFDSKTGEFDKSSNVRVFEYETTSTFGGIIHSFNVTTNHWAGNYVFKRLRFLKSKFLSHILTLVYLALWHGYKSGYYITFTIEFLIMKVEKEVMDFIAQKRKEDKSLDEFLARPLVYWTSRVFFRIYTLVVFGYCLVPFLLLNYVKWWDVLKELYFFGHVIYIPAVILTPILLHQFKSRRKERDASTSPSVQDKKIN